MAHVYEFNLNRYIIEGAEGEGLKRFLKPLSSDAAFNKGVDYFAEIVFFYGLLMLVAIYEIRKSHYSSEAAKVKLVQNSNDVISIKADSEKLLELLKKSHEARVQNYLTLEHINDEMKAMEKETREDVRKGVFGIAGKTPMVEIASLSQLTGCKILAKCEHLNPSSRAIDRALAYSLSSLDTLPELKKIQLTSSVKSYKNRAFVSEADDSALIA